MTSSSVTVVQIKSAECASVAGIHVCLGLGLENIRGLLYGHAALNVPCLLGAQTLKAE